MRKLYLLITAVIFIFLPIATHAAEPPVVVIQYQDALQMALRDMLPVRGTDAQILEMQNQRDDLREHILHLERNTLSPEMQRIVNDMHDQLMNLEMQIYGAAAAQNHLQQAGESALQAFIAGLNYGSADGYMLQTAIQGLVAAQGLGGTVSVLEDARSSMWREMNSFHNQVNPYDYVLDGNRRNLNEMERQMQGLRFQQDQQILAREYALRSAIIAIEGLTHAIEIAEQGITLAETSFGHMSIMHGLGMVSIIQLQTAEQELAQHRMELSETQLQKNSMQQHLNHMLGQPLSQRTVIAFERELPQLPANISRHISQTVAASHTVRSLELNVESARYALRNFNEARDREIERNQNDGRRDETDRVRTENDRTRDALQEAYNMAIASRNQAAQALESAMLHGHNELARLQTRIEVQTTALAIAETGLQTTQTNFELGRATRHELEQAQFSVFAVQQAIEATLNQKWLLAFALDNPSLLFYSM